MTLVACPDEIWSAAKDHLLGGEGERFGFFLAGTVQTPDGPRFCVRAYRPVPDNAVQWGQDLPRVIELGEILEVINEAKRENLAVIEAHSHPHAQDNVEFSWIDNEGFQEFVPYVLDSLEGRPYGALVFGRSSVDGRYWTRPNQGGPLEKVVVAGGRLDIIRPTGAPERTTGTSLQRDRFDRQILAVGQEGQREFADLTVAVVGLGGLGSHVVQQLAYLGVRSFILVDDDSVEDSNLNRLVGARPDDAGEAKVRIARRIVDRIAGSEETAIRTAEVQVPDPLADDLLATADIVFGCADNDGARLILNQLAKGYNLPYFDLGSAIEVDEGEIRNVGGRIAYVGPEGPCLNCMGEVDRTEARFFLSSDEEQESDIERGYVDEEDLIAPSVVSLNGAVASLAVNAFVLHVTGIDPPEPLVYYYASEPGPGGQRLSPRAVEAREDCYTCALRGKAGTGVLLTA